MATVVDKPYGSWSSPITSKSITAGSVKLGNIHYNPHTNNLYWVEGRPQEAGRNVLCKVDPLDDNASERGGVDIMSSKESNVRTRVHEYGGGAVVHGKVSERYVTFFTAIEFVHMICIDTLIDC